MQFGEFLSKFVGRYVKLTRLDVAGRMISRTEVATGILVIVVIVGFLPQSPIQRSLLEVGAKPGDPQAHLELAGEAAKINDYKLAESEYQLASQVDSEKVLGVRDEVFPEEVLREEIANLEKLAEKVEARDIYLKLAILYWRLFDEEKAKKYFEQGRILDPNSEQVKEIQELTSN